MRALLKALTSRNTGLWLLQQQRACVSVKAAPVSVWTNKMRVLGMYGACLVISEPLSCFTTFCPVL
jgi:hypothetical protein